MKREKSSLEDPNLALATLAHEVAKGLNPLCLALTRALDADPSSHDIALALTAVNHVSSLINPVLRMFGTNNDGSHTAESNFGLTESLAFVRDLCVLTADDAGVSFALDGHRDLPLVHGAKTYLQEVLINLVANAISYASIRHKDGGGVVSLQVCAGEEEGVYVFEVKDNGAGMGVDVQDRLFSAFARGGDPEHKGAGIGLHTCLKQVTSMGGSIWFESELGVGTTFFVKVPLPAVVVSAVAAVVQSEVTPGNVLVVDDDEDLAGLVRRELRKDGASVLSTDSSEEALRIAETTPIDLILVDMSLGGGQSGTDVVTHLRALPNLAHVYIAGMSGWPDHDVAFMAAGADAFVEKTVYLEGLPAVWAQAMSLEARAARNVRLL